MKKLITFGAIAAGALVVMRYLSGKKSAIENLKIVPISIAIDSQRSRNSFFSRLFYRVKLRLLNQESQPIMVRAMDLTVFYKNNQIGKIIRDQDFIVPGRGTQTVELDAQVEAVSIITSIIELASSIRSSKKIEFRIRGFVETDLGRIPVDFTKNIDL